MHWRTTLLVYMSTLLFFILSADWYSLVKQYVSVCCVCVLTELYCFFLRKQPYHCAASNWLNWVHSLCWAHNTIFGFVKHKHCVGNVASLPLKCVPLTEAEKASHQRRARPLSPASLLTASFHCQGTPFCLWPWQSPSTTFSENCFAFPRLARTILQSCFDHFVYYCYSPHHSYKWPRFAGRLLVIHASSFAFAVCTFMQTKRCVSNFFHWFSFCSTSAGQVHIPGWAVIGFMCPISQAVVFLYR